MSAAARRRGDEARSHAARWLWAYGTSPRLFPRIRKGSLLASFQIVLAAPYHQVHVCRQNAASGKIVELRANNGEKDWHETTSVLPKRGTNALGQKQHKQGDHHASHYVVQVHHVPSLHLFLPRVLTLQLDLLRPLVRCTCTEQYRSTLLLRTL